ncbi:MAG: DUF2232 domain-containing protein [Desulfuromonadales bacterium]
MMRWGLYILLGACAGYGLFGTYAAFGFAAIIVNLFTPLPAAYVGMRLGGASAALTVAVTLALVLVTGNLTQGVTYLLQFGLPGAVLPWLLHRGLAWDKAVAAVIWVMVAASLAGLLAYASLAGQSPLTLTGNMISSEIAETKTVMQEMFAGSDIPADQQQDVAEAVESMAVFLQKAYPGIVITVAGLMTLGLVLLLSLLARGHYPIPGPAFPSWKAPEPLVWGLIAAGFLVAFGDGLFAVFALNLLVVLLPVYFLQGLAVIDCFFRRKAFSPVFRAIGYVLVTLVNPLPMLVTGIGVFDLWADFRKPREPQS